MGAVNHDQHTTEYYTLKQAADIKRIPYWKLLRACNDGQIPTYRLGNSRRYVRLEDIDAALKATMVVGGDHE